MSGHGDAPFMVPRTVIPYNGATCHQSLVIVNDLNFVGVSIPPGETKSPLVVDANAVLSFASPMQRFQAIARWRRHVAQFRGAVQLPQFSARDVLDRLKTPAAVTLVKPLSLAAPERPDHDLNNILYNV
jgi:hypothetical protein